jgi:hypothetical protein
VTLSKPLTPAAMAVLLAELPITPLHRAGCGGGVVVCANRAVA